MNKSSLILKPHYKEEGLSYPGWTGYNEFTEIFEKKGCKVGSFCEELGEAYFYGQSYEAIAEDNTTCPIRIESITDDEMNIYCFYLDEHITLKKAKG